MRSFIISVLLLLLSGFSVSSAYAHTLENDNTIGAILHINPDDNPQIGQEQSFVLAFRDKSGQFALENCSCRYRLLGGGQEIYGEALNAQNKTSSLNFYTFNQAGIYQMEVIGEPNGVNGFQPFKLIYDIRVIGTGGDSNEHLVPTMIASLLVLQIFLLSGLVYKIKTKTSE